jgi:hypothetical protein
VAKALAWFVELYPDRVEELLLLLACDPCRRVRHAAATTLATLLPAVDNFRKLMEVWLTEHPERAQKTLLAARRWLPRPLGV